MTVSFPPDLRRIVTPARRNVTVYVPPGVQEVWVHPREILQGTQAWRSVMIRYMDARRNEVRREIVIARDQGLLEAFLEADQLAPVT